MSIFERLTNPAALLMIRAEKKRHTAVSILDRKEEKTMKYECPCGYIYDPEVGDPEGGIAAGTAWEDIPEDWVCPVCGLGKDAFTPV